MATPPAITDPAPASAPASQRQQMLHEHLQRLDDATRLVTSFHTWSTFRRECANGHLPVLDPRKTTSPQATSAKQLLFAELRSRGLPVSDGEQAYTDRQRSGALSNYTGLVLIGFDFSGEDLSGASFAGAILQGADFSHATLNNTDFSGARLDGALFTGAELVTADLSRITGERVSFVSASLEGALFTSATLTSPDFSIAQARTSLDFGSVNFSQATLLSATFCGCDFTGAIFTGANLTGADLSPPRPAHLEDKPIEVLEYRFIGVERSRDKPAVYTGGAIFSKANLKGANLTRACLSHADFRDASLSGAALNDANMIGADLEGADLTGADFSGAMVDGALLDSARLTDPPAIPTPSPYEGRQAEPLVKIHEVHDIILRALTVTITPELSSIVYDSTLPGLRDGRLRDLRGADLSGADLSRYDLRGARLDGADLSGAQLCHSDLSRANFDSADLTGADLSHATLVRTQLWGANLCGARLDGASLRNAQLTAADLSDASIHGVDLSGATLRGVKIDVLSLPGGRLRGADLQGLRLGDLRLADLRGADLRNTDLSEAIFDSAQRARALFGTFPPPPLPRGPHAGPLMPVFIAEEMRHHDRDFSIRTVALPEHDEAAKFMAGQLRDSVCQLDSAETEVLHEWSFEPWVHAGDDEALMAIDEFVQCQTRAARAAAAEKFGTESANDVDMAFEVPDHPAVPSRVDGRRVDELLVHGHRINLVNTSRSPEHDRLAQRAAVRFAARLQRLPEEVTDELAAYLRDEDTRGAHPHLIYSLQDDAAREVAPDLTEPLDFVRCHLEAPGIERQSPGLHAPVCSAVQAARDYGHHPALLTERRRESDAQVDRAACTVTGKGSFAEFERLCARGYTPTIRLERDDSMETIREKDLVASELLAAGHCVFDGVRTLQPAAPATNRHPTTPRSAQRSQVRDLDEDHELSR